MQLHSNDITNGISISGEFAFAVPGNPVTLSSNRNPHLSWGGAPENTRSFVITCIDIDVPSRGDDVNQADREVPSTLPRVEFVHWLMANIPANCTEIAAGSCSDGITARGKQSPHGPDGSVQGLNDYTGWFAGDKEMSGNYIGYDGPCPPWNDSLIHHYNFTVHALDVAKLNLEPGFTLAQLRAAMQGHVLQESTIQVTYTLNKRLLGG